MRSRSVAALALAVGLVSLSGGPAHAAGPDLLTWGYNNQGQLGDATTSNRSTPVFPALSPGVTVVDIAAGREDTAAFLLSTGQLFTMGNNQYGQLGNGANLNAANSTPVSVVTTGLPLGVTFVDVAAGVDHMIARASDGSVWAWGRNLEGQLGDGTTTASNVPVPVDLPPGAVVTAIATGNYHNLAITDGGAVLAWGYNVAGQLGDGTGTNRTTPVVLTLPGGAGAPVAVAANGNHSLILDDAGVAYTVGAGTLGLHCNGGVASLSTAIAVALPGGALASAIGAGNDTSHFVTTTGGVFSCGDGNVGELGNGAVANSSTPVAMILPPGTTAIAVEGENDGTIVLTLGGRVFGSGFNNVGQLGDGTGTNRSTPVPSLIGSGTTLNQIAGGGNTSMGVGIYSLTGVPLAKTWMAVGGGAVMALITAAWGVRRRRRSHA